MSPGRTLDPITFEVIRNALVAATDEMVLTLRRSAYSTNIKTRADFSCAFFDAELRAVAQGFTQPVHLGSMVEQVPHAVRSYGVSNLGPGDVVITNEPFPSGVHLNDVSLISPVFADGELLGYVANLAHHVDVGGGAPASIGAFREVFQEGVIIPPVKVVAAGRIVDDVFDLILAQIRSKHETAGDFRAQIAANATGARRLEALVTRHGRPTIVAAMHELLEYTERRTRAELAALPQGVYEAEGLRRHRRLHRRAGPTPRPCRDHADRRLVRPRRQRPAAPGAGQLDLRPDLLRLRVRAQVPDRPRPPGQRRLLPARHARRPARDGDELHVALARRRRLGDADPPRRRDLPRPAPCSPDGAAGGDEGDDVPRRLRRRRQRHERVRLLPRDVRRRLRRPPRERRAGRRAGARAEHRERARRGDRAQLPGAHRPAGARRGLRGAGSLPRRARAAQGLPLRSADDVHRPLGSHRRPGRPVPSAATPAESPSTC